MHELRRFQSFVLVLAFLFATPASAVEDEQAIIYVRKDCTGVAYPCKTLLADALTWVFTTHHPSPSPTDPVLMDIGPGKWSEQWSCNGESGVTVRGAGRDITFILGTGSGSPAADIENCSLAFSDLTFESTGAAVVWDLGGTSKWDDVDLTSTGGGTDNLAWKDEPCAVGQTENADHYFFGVRATSIMNSASTADNRGVFALACSDVHFYSGEILWNSTGLAGGAFGANTAAIRVSANSSFEAYGVAIRSKHGATGQATTGTMTTVLVTDWTIDSSTFTGQAASFDLHGGIINLTIVDDTTVPATAVALRVSGNAIGNTSGSAYVVNVPAATAGTRVLSENGGSVDAPLLLQPGDTPPWTGSESASIAGEDGDDLFVEIDCQPNGDCDPTDCDPLVETCTDHVEAHLMVYNAALCTVAGNPWFDTVTGRCRNDTNDVVEILEALTTSLDGRIEDLEALHP